MQQSFTIIEDDPRRAEIAALLQQHLEDMARHSPPESMHALDVEGLSAEGITFWSVWTGKELVGCGALKQLDSTHGEIKSMHTASAHLRRGVASFLLTHVIAEARRRGYLRLTLETGSMEAYEPARQLYGRFGFETCEPFGDYVPDPNSTFMSREL
jgi:putative acetyltransferase